MARQNVFGMERWASALGGIGLLALAARRGGRPVPRLLTALAGATLAARGISGHCAIRAALARRTPDEPVIALPPPPDQPAVRVAYPERRTTADIFGVAEEDVDVASQDSFPASDPPGYIPIRAAADGAFGRR